MYLWKLWRESRIALGAALFGILALFTFVISIDMHWHLQEAPARRALFLAFVLIPFFQAVPVSFFGWALGSMGIGRDLGEKSGSYILSRPRPRRYFAWCDWGFGIAMLLAVTAVLNAGLWFLARPAVLDKITLHKNSVPISFVFGLAWTSVFLLSGLIFSLTYFSTVLLKHSRGILLSAGLLVGYTIFGAAIKHYLPGVELPRLLMQTWTSSGGFADHLGESIALRAVALLIFPIAAQIVLQRAEI